MNNLKKRILIVLLIISVISAVFMTGFASLDGNYQKVDDVFMYNASEDVQIILDEGTYYVLNTNENNSFYFDEFPKSIPVENKIHTMTVKGDKILKCFIVEDKSFFISKKPFTFETLETLFNISFDTEEPPTDVEPPIEPPTEGETDENPIQPPVEDGKEELPIIPPTEDGGEEPVEPPSEEKDENIPLVPLEPSLPNGADNENSEMGNNGNAAVDGNDDFNPNINTAKEFNYMYLLYIGIALAGVAIFVGVGIVIIVRKRRKKE